MILPQQLRMDDNPIGGDPLRRCESVDETGLRINWLFVDKETFRKPTNYCGVVVYEHEGGHKPASRKSEQPRSPDRWVRNPMIVAADASDGRLH